jgi:hypothetical protein
MGQQLIQAIITAVVLAVIFALAKLFWDVQTLKTQAAPLLEWWRKTSMDALKIATNPTSQRLTELADKYIASQTGKGKITTEEKQELIDGLREVMNDPRQFESKRQSASLSLRFIETREGLTSKAANHS